MRSCSARVGRLGRLAVDEPVNVLAANPDPSVADPNRGEFASRDIVSNGHLVQLQQLGDFGDRHELVRHGLLSLTEHGVSYTWLPPEVFPTAPTQLFTAVLRRDPTGHVPRFIPRRDV